MKAIAIATMDGKKIPIVHHPSLDADGPIPQASAIRVAGRDYILVGIGFLSAPAEVQRWIISHELGHIKYNHQRFWLVCFFHNIMRKYMTFKPTIDRELLADKFANESVGASGGIRLFKALQRVGINSVENQKRYAACVAYQQGEMA